ncbi:MAG: trypsin-like peptidase domain-containing protein [Actinobacteria bacterium]|nr:trypsin-like peptidase domain-containing protein [Actinomycetota bacterium]
MRAGSAAALVLIAAVLGAVAVLVGVKAAGWLHAGTTRTVVIQQSPVREGGAAAPVVVSKPLLGNGFQPAQIFRSRSPGVVTIISYFGSATGVNATAGQGSGFVVSADGVILTNAHVVTTAGQGQVGSAKSAGTVYVEFSDGDRVTAKVIGYDLFDDVGVIRVDPADHALSPVPLGNSGRVVVGEPVAAIGSPFGNVDSLSVGVVSAIRRSIPSLTTKYNLVDAIQTDAPINHGNSGGPLFDAAGRVIGINAQIRSSGTGSGFEGVGFAVPIDSARRSLQQLLRSGSVAYAYVGITTEDLTPSIAKKFGYATEHGALVDTVVPGAAGARAGLMAGTRDAVYQGLDVTVGGDAIVAIDGIPVTHAEDIVRIVAERLLPGETAHFTVVRGRARRTVEVMLGDRPTTP